MERVKRCHDTDRTERMMKKGFRALKGKKNTFRKEVKATEWAFDRTKESFEQIAQDKVKKMSIVQEIMIRSTDYLRIIAPVVRLEDYIWWVPTWWCDMRREIRLEATEHAFLSYKQVVVLIRPRYSKHMHYLGLLRKFDQCVEVVGESARRWRRLLTEDCEGPGVRRAEKVSRTACVNAQELIISSPWNSDT